MKIISYFLSGIIIFLIGCNGKKRELNNQGISALSIIKGQINHLDTSFYQIRKLETHDGKADTSFIKREEVKNYSSDFLSLPDITEKGFKEKYTEERLIDNSQNSLSIIYTAKDDVLEIRKQIIIIPVDELANGKVTSIYFDVYKMKNDTLIEQKLFWQMNKYFHIGNIIMTKDQPEKITFLKVYWE